MQAKVLNWASVVSSPLALAGLYLLGVPAQGAEAVGEPTQEVVVRTAPVSSAIEEVEIIGERPLRFLIHEIELIEERMFDQFNELNDINEFRVVCRSVIITGSRIPGRECVPVYVDRARAESTREFLMFGTPQKPDSQIWFENRHKQEAFNVKIRELAIEHPGLANSMLELNAKKQELEELQKRQRERTKGWLGRLFPGPEDE